MWPGCGDGDGGGLVGGLDAGVGVGAGEAGLRGWRGWLGVALWRVTRLLGSGRSSVVSHQGTACCFMVSRTKPGVRGGASPFIISWWKLPTGWTWPRG